MQIGKRVNKVGRRLIRISTAEGKWQGNCNADYIFSLRDLRLDDLVEDGDPNSARVFVSLTIHRVFLFSQLCLVKNNMGVCCKINVYFTSMQDLGFRLMGQLTHLLTESVATALCLTAER